MDLFHLYFTMNIKTLRCVTCLIVMIFNIFNNNLLQASWHQHWSDAAHHPGTRALLPAPFFLPRLPRFQSSMKKARTKTPEPPDSLAAKVTDNRQSKAPFLDWENGRYQIWSTNCDKIHFLFTWSNGPCYSHYCNNSMYCNISDKYIMARWV